VQTAGGKTAFLYLGISYYTKTYYHKEGALSRFFWQKKEIKDIENALLFCVIYQKNHSVRNGFWKY
jgi:hypothetical protein